MIIGLYGLPYTGKTTIAQSLATMLRIPLRSCGQVVRSHAEALCLSHHDLPDEHHIVVDEETRAWAMRMQRAIVEGRFLDRVLWPLRAQTLAIRLTASEETRCRRAVSRIGRVLTPQEIKDHYLFDLAFRQRLYCDVGSIEPALTIDTSESTVETCVLMIMSHLKDAAG
jgi:cytidylate kinase